MNKYKHIMAALYEQPWLISQAGMDLVCSIAERQGDVEALLAKRGDKIEKGSRTVVRDRVAVVPITGPIFRYANLFTEISGATSIGSVAEEFQQAMDNAKITTIILNHDTPGGQVNGINEFAAMVKEAGQTKHVVAYVGHQAASGGYWTASAANEIVIDKTAMLGSIGVVISYCRSDGSRLVEIVNEDSPNKRLDPDSETGRQAILARANALARVFIDTVAANRKVSRETVIKEFGAGGMLVGSDAIQAGMADRFGSLEGLIEEYNNKNMPRPISRPAATTAASGAVQTETEEGSQMNKKDLMAKYPEACQEILNDGKTEGKAEGQAALEKAATDQKEAVSAENGRILGLLAVHLGEDETNKFKQVVDTGVSVDQFKAIRGSAPTAPAGSDTAQKTKEELLAAIHQAGPANPGSGTDDQTAGKDFDALVADYQALHKCSKGEAMQKVQAEHPEAHKVWLEKQQAK